MDPSGVATGQGFKPTEGAPLLSPIPFTVEDRMTLRLIYLQQKSLQIQMEAILSALSGRRVVDSGAGSPNPAVDATKGSRVSSIQNEMATPATTPVREHKIESGTDSRDTNGISFTPSPSPNHPLSPGQQRAPQDASILSSHGGTRLSLGEDDVSLTLFPEEPKEERESPDLRSSDRAQDDVPERRPTRSISSTVQSRVTSRSSSAFEDNPLLSSRRHQRGSETQRSKCPSRCSRSNSQSSSLPPESGQTKTNSLTAIDHTFVPSFTAVTEWGREHQATQPTTAVTLFPDPQRKVVLGHPRSSSSHTSPTALRHAPPDGGEVTGYMRHSIQNYSRPRRGVFPRGDIGHGPHVYDNGTSRALDDSTLSAMDFFSDGSYDTLEYLRRNELIMAK